MEFKNLLIEKENGVVLLTINSPRTMNALNSEVIRELECAFYELNLDDDVKAVVLTGAGEKAFVAGADIKEMSAMTACEALAFAKAGQRLMTLIGRMTKPVIAAVNGYALGGGLELALACDFIYASEKARLGLPEVTLGVIPGFGGTQNLARLIGPNRAKELALSGKMITADKALAWGLVNELFPPEELVAKAKECAAQIASVCSISVGFVKDAVNSGLDMSREDGLRYEASLFSVLFSTEDQKEGMGAFLEKRKAVFKGR